VSQRKVTKTSNILGNRKGSKAESQVKITGKMFMPMKKPNSIFLRSTFKNADKE
jgi:hypothetical protein